ncbi:hypothetical protein [Nocardioides flavescens]|uniref:DUF732 domain-containing protein n=1 Tax=Nocardioides flavescens TaxID=2691959 RepID=A0A6L7ET49_9ACTN|nr:hypothetical protein [Nocardioides flavescens]MXG88776.1 hypothetical protein [Nocardioides flavescens]
MKKLIPAVTLFVALAACGGGGGGRPSTSEIADTLKGSDSPLGAVTDSASDDVIDCIAKTLHDSDVSDKALQALVDGDDDYDGSDSDKKAVEAASDDLAKCATAS